jgi:hypothetical protein
MIGHRRLLVDTIHKQAQMLKPKTYGAKLDLTSGNEPIRPVDEISSLTRLASLASKLEERLGSPDDAG